MTDFHPRILVVARASDHGEWEAIIASPPDTLDPNRVVVPLTNLYGSRFDLIIVDLPYQDRTTNRFLDWYEQGVRCRLSPRGKIVVSRL